MMYFKECPKCHGDLYTGEDVHGRYVSCFQCGFMRDLPTERVQPPVRETLVIDAPKTVKKSQKKVRQAA